MSKLSVNLNSSQNSSHNRYINKRKTPLRAEHFSKLCTDVLMMIMNYLQLPDHIYIANRNLVMDSSLWKRLINDKISTTVKFGISISIGNLLVPSIFYSETMTYLHSLNDYQQFMFIMSKQYYQLLTLDFLTKRKSRFSIDNVMHLLSILYNSDLFTEQIRKVLFTDSIQSGTELIDSLLPTNFNYTFSNNFNSSYTLEIKDGKVIKGRIYHWNLINYYDQITIFDCLSGLEASLLEYQLHLMLEKLSKLNPNPLLGPHGVKGPTGCPGCCCGGHIGKIGHSGESRPEPIDLINKQMNKLHRQAQYHCRMKRK